MNDSDNQYINDQFIAAAWLHQSGSLPAAKSAYEAVILQSPQHSQALHHLGVLLSQTGEPKAGAELLQRAVAIEPGNARYYTNLALALTNSDQKEKALAAYQRSIELNPGDPLANNNLSSLLRIMGKPAEAADACRRALKLKPDYGEAFNNLGNALKDLGQISETVAAYRQAAQLRPDIPSIHNNLANALISTGDFKAAVDACQAALSLDPGYAEAFINLGTALGRQNLWSEAIAAYQRACELNPNLTEANLNLVNALTHEAKVEQASAILSRVTLRDTAVAKAYINLGYAFACQGMIERAVEFYRHGLAIHPEFEQDHSYLVFSANLHPDYSARQIFEEAARWEARHAKPLFTAIQPLYNEPSPDRALKIGYLSPDYRDHTLGWFMPPILENHDRSRFEIHCFSVSREPDHFTDKLRSMSNRWHDVAYLNDEELANLIRRERIDILVDQADHCINNRLLVFARKPAPVQVSYLAYFGTTGLHTMDYLLCDPHMELPEDLARHCLSENQVRLPRTYWCYRAHINSPDVGPLPAASNGYITFGCMNDPCKLNQAVWTAWYRILKAIPTSRLIVFAGAGPVMVEASRRIMRLLQEAGIEPNRVETLDSQNITNYLATYNRIDIGLDPFPYTGGATTCDALWMGVPVVSLVGQTTVSRGGLSLLSNVDLGDLAARSVDEYVQTACELASNHSRLESMRSSLRSRIQQSPTMNEKQFITELESAYRWMWKTWCGSQQ